MVAQDGPKAVDAGGRTRPITARVGVNIVLIVLADVGVNRRRRAVVVVVIADGDNEFRFLAVDQGRDLAFFRLTRLAIIADDGKLDEASQHLG